MSRARQAWLLQTGKLESRSESLWEETHVWHISSFLGQAPSFDKLAAAATISRRLCSTT